MFHFLLFDRHIAHQRVGHPQLQTLKPVDDDEPVIGISSPPALCLVLWEMKEKKNNRIFRIDQGSHLQTLGQKRVLKSPYALLATSQAKVVVNTDKLPWECAHLYAANWPVRISWWRRGNMATMAKWWGGESKTDYYDCIMMPLTHFISHITCGHSNKNKTSIVICARVITIPWAPFSCKRFTPAQISNDILLNI